MKSLLIIASLVVASFTLYSCGDDDYKVSSEYHSHKYYKANPDDPNNYNHSYYQEHKEYDEDDYEAREHFEEDH